jgi:hypothetical protein
MGIMSAMASGIESMPASIATTTTTMTTTTIAITITIVKIRPYEASNKRAFGRWRQQFPVRGQIIEY